MAFWPQNYDFRLKIQKRAINVHFILKGNLNMHSKRNEIHNNIIFVHFSTNII